MSKHTKGPWVARVVRGMNASVYGPDEKSVASVGNARSRSTEECEANAHLIAAAPELLEELSELVNLIAHEYPAQQKTWLEGARKAIAKARGEV